MRRAWNQNRSAFPKREFPGCRMNIGFFVNPLGGSPLIGGLLRGFLEGGSFPYFLREFSKHVEFPERYHPIDYPLYHLSHCPSAPDREQYLMNRHLDLYLAWGASHPWRNHISEHLRGLRDAIV